MGKYKRGGTLWLLLENLYGSRGFGFRQSWNGESRNRFLHRSYDHVVLRRPKSNFFFFLNNNTRTASIILLRNM